MPIKMQILPPYFFFRAGYSQTAKPTPNAIIYFANVRCSQLLQNFPFAKCERLPFERTNHTLRFLICQRMQKRSSMLSVEKRINDLNDGYQ
jgi:hypothetical protein